MFRDPDGSLVPQEELKREFRYFPSDAVYRAFSCAGRADSIAVDPHKLGYVPWLLFADDDGTNTLDRYLAFLEGRIRVLADALNASLPGLC